MLLAPPGQAVLGALDGLLQRPELAPGRGPVTGSAVQAVGVEPVPEGPCLHPPRQGHAPFLAGAAMLRNERDGTGRALSFAAEGIRPGE